MPSASIYLDMRYGEKLAGNPVDFDRHLHFGKHRPSPRLLVYKELYISDAIIIEFPIPIALALSFSDRSFGIQGVSLEARTLDITWQIKLPTPHKWA